MRAAKESVRRTALRTSKNASMLLAGTMTRMIASFVFVLYCADRLGVEGFGKFSIAIHYFELFLSLTSTAVCILLTRDMARWPSHGRQLMTSATIQVLLLWLLAPACMAGVGFLFNYSSDTVAALMVASIGLVPAGLCAVAEAAFVAKERAELVTIGTIVESLLRIVLSIGALVLGFGIVGLIAVLCFVRLMLLLMYAIGLARIGLLGVSFSLSRTRRFAKRWRVFAAENWMAAIYTNLDVIVLSWVSGEVATGLYSAAWKIVRLGSVVAKSYTTAVFPVMSRMYAESREGFVRLYRQTIRVMCMLALPVIAVVTVVPDRVIGLLFSEEYAAAAAVLQVLIWVLLIEFLNPFLSHALFAQGKQHHSMRVAGISLCVNSVATYLLVVRFGAVGAALGTVLGGLVATVCYMFFAMPKLEILNTALGTLRVVLASAGLACVVFLIREYSWVALALTSATVYTLLLFVCGAFSLHDMRRLRGTFLARTAS